MTANQVAYWQLQEAKRHNLLDEAIRKRTNENNRARIDTQNVVDMRNADTNRENASTNIRMARASEKQANVAQNKLGADYINSFGNVIKSIGGLFK